MTSKRLHGVIAAIPTPFGADGEPDIDLFVAFARRLLDEGCDGLNVCGTTGEATSMSVAQRKAVMDAAASALPGDRLMVGTGTSAIADTVELTRYAAELGFAGALLLPPFYYKGVENEGVIAGFEKVANATQDTPIPLYLYNFPALSGVPFTRPLVEAMRARIPGRIVGLKDSSGDLDYADDMASIDGFDVFPSNEATLMDARAGRFAGCISATANLSARACAAAYREGATRALAIAVEIRRTVSAGPLIPGVKAVVADLMGEPAYRRLLPPLVSLGDEAATSLTQAVGRLIEESKAVV